MSRSIRKQPRSASATARSLKRGRCGFPIENQRKTTPAASASVAARHFLDDAATPCGDARRGITLDCNSFTPSEGEVFKHTFRLLVLRARNVRKPNGLGEFTQTGTSCQLPKKADFRESRKNKGNDAGRPIACSRFDVAHELNPDDVPPDLAGGA